MQKIIFLRHADTEKDPTKHASLWGLSEEGTRQAEAVADLDDMRGVEGIYVSEEVKTHLTVAPLAQKLGLTPVPLAAFDEVRRGEKFLTKEEFEEEKKKQLIDLNFPAFGGETGMVALARFKEGVQRVLDENPGKTILIATHGTVLNMYFADLLGSFDTLPERWKKTGFCAYGVVEDGAVTRDINAPIES